MTLIVIGAGQAALRVIPIHNLIERPIRAIIERVAVSVGNAAIQSPEVACYTDL